MSSLGSGPGRERGPGGPSPNGEKVVTLVKPYNAEVWVYRCGLSCDERTHGPTTQPGNKSGPDKATEGTTALGSNIGGSVDSGGSAAGAVPSAGPGPGRERGPGGPSSNGEKVVTCGRGHERTLTALIVTLVVTRSTNA